MVKKSGRIEDYLNVPIIKDGTPFGAIYKVEEVEDKFELSIVVWRKFLNFDYSIENEGELVSITIN